MPMLKKFVWLVICAICSISAYADDLKMHIIITADGQAESAIELTADTEIYIDVSTGLPKLSVDGVLGDEISFDLRESKLEDILGDDSDINILYVDRTITIDGYEGSYYIYDINGRMVSSGISTEPIDVSLFHKGVYVLVVSNQTLKFIKQ